MMDSDRPHHHHHRTGSTSSELFICFTSRISSSSMKISSKSILSPGRSRDPQQQHQQQQPVSLSNSLSRRLRPNGSMRGGQASPMFPTGACGKKRGSGFENPEPSSPKVTCIGQVRVKTKKQGKKMRTLSKRRRSGGGEVSFRKVDLSREGVTNQQQQECLNQRNQRWVHLPLTICEALRAFGAEFSCLFPCRSSCSSTTDDREKEEKAAGREGEGRSSCGAVFARWLVAVQDGEGGKQREIELVVGGEEEEEEVLPKQSSSFSRHAMVSDEKWDVKNDDDDDGEEEEEEEEEGRVSICIPPKNALLLMRCRSDPVKMSALANRFWEPPVCNEEDEDDDDDDDGLEVYKHNGNEEQGNEELSFEDEGCQVLEELLSNEVVDEEDKLETETNVVVMEVQEDEEEVKDKKLEEEEEEEDEHEELEICEEEELEIEEREEKDVEEIITQKILEDLEAIVDLEKLENEEDEQELIQSEQVLEEEGEGRESHCSSVDSQLVHSDLEVDEDDKAVTVTLAESEAALVEETEKSTEEDETREKKLLEENEERVTEEEFQPKEDSITNSTQENNEEEELHLESEEREEVERESTEEVKKQERESSSVLPDCLLLMMCEPKLSMEVSKETWVCSTDFIRRLPAREVKKTDGSDEPKKRVSVASNPSHPAHHQHLQPPLQQPHRSSCSFPVAPAASGAGVSMATMIEQKLVSGGAYEPFGLTRCKSEPMRTAAAKLAVPEACFWKNRKMEPHRRSTFGIGAAGVGF